MAGAGWRTFVAGEVLTADNVQTYLQDQVVMVFAGTAERAAALGTSVSEGMVSYLTSDNTLTAYNGVSWEAVSGGGAGGFETNFLLMGA